MITALPAAPKSFRAIGLIARLGDLAHVGPGHPPSPTIIGVLGMIDAQTPMSLPISSRFWR